MSPKLATVEVAIGQDSDEHAGVAGAPGSGAGRRGNIDVEGGRRG